ncbi:hypothetical protein DNHGIG_12230 [Collibacillus ludicampi]|uniref:Uncharacterized protein n=1 Tax=Collibacillus ludicampi TaxID=2771369 RepID=A0AAV4LCV7_9BACL|nr:competence protein ComK [Collibacillus ludicampi]GIM45674.1 hypothetical protein DNHGIG_12230 [Collibacillus ludicampi]
MLVMEGIVPIPRVLDVEEYWGKLAGCIPLYMDGYGDVTEVILNDGTSKYDRRPIQHVMEHIATFTGSNLTSLRRCYGDIISRKKHVPLPLSPKILFIPCKCRTPRVASDSATGYVVYQQIEEVVQTGSGGSAILLTNGRQIHCMQSARYVEEQLCRARIIEMFYHARMFGYEHLLTNWNFGKKKRRERLVNQLSVLVNRSVEGIPDCNFRTPACGVCKKID